MSLTSPKSMSVCKVRSCASSTIHLWMRREVVKKKKKRVEDYVYLEKKKETKIKVY
jgi:hypothetical protein